MRATSNIAFKEWGIVVDALSRGEQILILRKGGIREARGRFDVEHGEFWLFPTQYHEAERSIIPSKRPDLHAITAKARQDSVDIEFFAVADPVIQITDIEQIGRLQGRHIWTENVLRDRFAFGSEPGLHALLARVYRRPAPARMPVGKSYSGCKSWIELDESLSTDGLQPVLTDAEFSTQRDEICELLSDHALAHS